MFNHKLCIHIVRNKLQCLHRTIVPALYLYTTYVNNFFFNCSSLYNSLVYTHSYLAIIIFKKYKSSKIL